MFSFCFGPMFPHRAFSFALCLGEPAAHHGEADRGGQGPRPTSPIPSPRIFFREIRMREAPQRRILYATFPSIEGICSLRFPAQAALRCAGTDAGAKTRVLAVEGIELLSAAFALGLFFLGGGNLALLRAVPCRMLAAGSHLKHPTALLADQDRHYLSPLSFFHHGFLASGPAEIPDEARKHPLIHGIRVRWEFQPWLSA